MTNDGARRHGPFSSSTFSWPWLGRMLTLPFSTSISALSPTSFPSWLPTSKLLTFSDNNNPVSKSSIAFSFVSNASNDTSQAIQDSNANNASPQCDSGKTNHHLPFLLHFQNSQLIVMSLCSSALYGITAPIYSIGTTLTSIHLLRSPLLEDC